MFEIILAIYLTGFTMSWALGLSYLYLLKKRFNSEKIKTLNQNLAQIQLFWSTTEGNFRELKDHNCISHDQKKAYKTAWIFITILSFMGMIGFVLLIAVMGSIVYLARSRVEQQVFKSDLCRSSLCAPDVATLASGIRNQG